MHCCVCLLCPHGALNLDASREADPRNGEKTGDDQVAADWDRARSCVAWYSRVYRGMVSLLVAVEFAHFGGTGHGNRRRGRMSAVSERRKKWRSSLSLDLSLFVWQQYFLCYAFTLNNTRDSLCWLVASHLALLLDAYAPPPCRCCCGAKSRPRFYVASGYKGAEGHAISCLTLEVPLFLRAFV